MRKSIFLTTILALFSHFVGLEQASAQTTPTTPDKNKNKIGVKHSFEVAITNTEGYTGSGLFNWYVTSNVTNLLKEDVVFVAGTGSGSDTEGVFSATNNYFSVDATGSAYHEQNIVNKDNTSKKITLTWKPEAVLKQGQYYLVLNYSEQATGASCLMNNIKVLKIDPINTFNLMVVAANKDGSAKTTDTDKELCAAKVKSATFVANKLKVLYENTTLYYKITASGFTGKWRPTINLPALNGITVADANAVKREYTSIQWKPLLAAESEYKDFKNSWTAGGALQKDLVADGVADVSTTATEDQNSILVKVVINNGTYEGLTKESVKFEAKGNMTKEGTTSGTYDSVDVRDVDTEDEGYKTLTEDRNDTSVLLARPTINSTSGEFITIIK